MKEPAGILSAFKLLTPDERKDLLKLLYKETETLQLHGDFAKYCADCNGLSISK